MRAKHFETVKKRSNEINPTKRYGAAQRGDRSVTAALFLLPGLIGFILFYIGPFIISVGYSFMTKPVGGEFAGISNYLGLFQNTSYQKAFINTVFFIGICVPLNMILSMSTSMLINKIKRYKEIFMLIFLIPLVIPSGSTVFFWEILFADNGWLNNIMISAGFKKVNWLNSSSAQFVMAFIFIWKNMGYNVVLFVAGLNNIPKEYYEAADVDGAGFSRKFKNITMPCISPVLVLVLIMSVINSFKIFKEIYLIMGDYPHESVYTLQHFMNNMFFSLNYQKLTTATNVLVLIMSFLAVFLLKFERRAAGE